MTPNEVAALLSVSRRTVLRLAEAGELPGLRVGSQWRFREQAVRSWVVDREAPLSDWQEARETGSRTEATSAPAAPVVARLAALPVGYQPVFGPDGRLATPLASPAGGRGRSATKRTKKAV